MPSRLFASVACLLIFGCAAPPKSPSKNCATDAECCPVSAAKTPAEPPSEFLADAMGADRVVEQQVVADYRVWMEKARKRMDAGDYDAALFAVDQAEAV